jgi:hypothetical protein
MKQSKIFDYYAFGFDFHLFIKINEESTYNQYQQQIEVFQIHLSKLDIPVTKSGLDVHQLTSDFEKVTKAIEDEKGENNISKSLHNSIQSKLKKLDSILDAELSTKFGYILEEKRYSNVILTKNIEKLFSDGVYYKLPSIAQYDFSESGMCLAFDRYTASSYHFLRGIEDVLKFYYISLTGNLALESDTWFKFTEGITTKITDGTINPAPSEELMANLNNLRKFYRNKTQHPDKIYSIDEAQDVFGIGIKTVNEIIKDIEDREII